MSDILQVFGQNLLKLMERRQMSFRDLAKATGINHASLNDYAHGKRNIPVTNAIIVARYFGQTVDDMVQPMDVKTDV